MIAVQEKWRKIIVKEMEISDVDLSEKNNPSEVKYFGRIYLKKLEVGGYFIAKHYNQL